MKSKRWMKNVIYYNVKFIRFFSGDKMAVLMRAMAGLSGLGLAAGCATAMRRQMGVLASQDPSKAK